MGFIPERTLEDIRSRTDIVDLIGSHIKLKRAGQNYLASCPFHKDKTPSFHVTPARQRYHCFGCNEDGDCFTFLMRYNGMTFIDAVTFLAERCGVTIESSGGNENNKYIKHLQTLHSDLAVFFSKCLSETRAAEDARRYINGRNLEGAIEEFQIGYAPNRWDIMERWAKKNSVDITLLEKSGLVKRSPKARSASGVYDRFRDRIMFPISDVQARVVGFSGRILHPDERAAKYVNSPETPLFHKSRILYGLDKARRNIVSAPNREAVVCEGQIDVIRCHIHGINTAVAAQGTAFTEQHVKLLKRYADAVVLIFDQDAAGLKASIRTARLFMSAGMPVRIVRLSAGDDPDSFLSTYGADSLRERISDAHSPVRFEVETLKSVEHDPDGVDAIARISRSVIESLASCSNAILRAHLIQEASDTLKLPETALNKELERFEEKAAARNAQREKFAAASNVIPDILDISLPTAEPIPEISGENDIQLADEIMADDIDSSIGDLIPDIISSTPENPPPPDKHISWVERLLCESLVHWIDQPEIIKLAVKHIPIRIVIHPFTRSILGAAIETKSDGTDRLMELRISAPDALKTFLCELEMAPSKMSGDEFSPQEAIKDAILGIWRAHLQHERSMLNIADQDALRRRQQISVLLGQLRSWKRGEHVIQGEMTAMMNGND